MLLFSAPRFVAIIALSLVRSLMSFATIVALHRLLSASRLTVLRSWFISARFCRVSLSAPCVHSLISSITVVNPILLALLITPHSFVVHRCLFLIQVLAISLLACAQTHCAGYFFACSCRFNTTIQHSLLQSTKFSAFSLPLSMCVRLLLTPSFYCEFSCVWFERHFSAKKSRTPWAKIFLFSMKIHKKSVNIQLF